MNDLFNGQDVTPDRLERIAGLFRMTISDDQLVMENLRGRPIYLALAMDENNKVAMMPQNLLVNLPLKPSS